MNKIEVGRQKTGEYVAFDSVLQVRAVGDSEHQALIRLRFVLEFYLETAVELRCSVTDLSVAITRQSETKRFAIELGHSIH